MRDASPFVPIETPETLAEAETRSGEEPVVIFKHSSRCGISARARQRLQALTEAGDPPVYEVVVQHARAVSDEIGQRYGLRHETPQVIVLHRGRPVFDASHSRVRAEAIRQAVTDLAPS